VKVFDSPIVMPCRWCHTTIEALQVQFIVKVIDAATVMPSQVPTNGVGQITIEALEVLFTVKVFESPIVMPCRWCQTTIEALQVSFIVKVIDAPTVFQN